MSLSEKSARSELLRRAIVNGELAEVRRLLHGQDVNQVDEAGWTYLHYACQSGQDDVARYLLENGAKVNLDAELFTPLMAACSVKDRSEEQLLKCVKLLLKHGADVNVMDRYQFTPLLYACRSGHEDIVSELLASNCDVNQTDNERRSALLYAVMGNHPNIVQMLLDKGASDLPDRRGNDALSVAYQKDLTTIIEMLHKPCEVTFEEQTVKKKSNFEMLISELPSYNSSDGKGGFPSDIEDLLHGVGLEHFSNLFAKKNVQLAKFLNIKDQELKEIGVMLSVHRKKIMVGNMRFVQYRWGPNVLPQVNKDTKIKMLDVVRGLANTVKQLHVLWASTLYATERVIVNSESQKVEELYQVSRRAVDQASTIVRELKAIRYYAETMAKYEQCVPADLILPVKAPQRHGLKKILLLSLLFGLVVWKSNVLKVLK